MKLIIILLPNKNKVFAGGESSLMELGDIFKNSEFKYVRIPFGKMNILKLIFLFFKLYKENIIYRNYKIHYIIPEVFIPYFGNLLKKIEYSIICLNHRYINKNWSKNTKQADIDRIYLNSNFIISHPGESYDYLKLLYPEKKLFKIFFSKNYNFENIKKNRIELLNKIEEKKSITIGFMPRKRKFEIETIIDELILASLKTSLEVKFVKIDGMKRGDAAKLMNNIDILFCTSYLEGYPRPPLEALSMGKILIGFDGGISNEYKNLIFVRNSQNTLEYLLFIKKLIDKPTNFSQQNEIDIFTKNIKQNINDTNNSKLILMEYLKYGLFLKQYKFLYFIFNRYNILKYLSR